MKYKLSPAELPNSQLSRIVHKVIRSSYALLQYDHILAIMKQWTLKGSGSFDSLHLEDAPVPQLGERDVLIKMQAVSLNFRDIMIVKVG